MSTTKGGIFAELAKRISWFESILEAAIQAVEAAKERLAKERMDDSPSELVDARSEVLRKPSPYYRVATAEAALRKRERERDDAQRNLDDARAVLATAETKNAAHAIAKFETAAAAAASADEQVTAGFLNAIQKLRTDAPELTKLVRTAQQARAGVPHEVLRALEPKETTTWLTSSAEHAIAQLEKVLTSP